MKPSSPLRPQRTSKVSFEECARRPGCLASCPCSKNLMKPNVPFISFSEEQASCTQPASVNNSHFLQLGLMRPVLRRPPQIAATAMGRGASPPASIGRFFNKEKGKARNSELWCVCICCEISVETRTCSRHDSEVCSAFLISQLLPVERL